MKNLKLREMKIFCASVVLAIIITARAAAQNVEAQDIELVFRFLRLAFHARRWLGCWDCETLNSTRKP
jgi:hypothetical protein